MPDYRRYPKPQSQQLILRLVRDAEALRLLTTKELSTISSFLETVRDEVSDALKRVNGKQ